MSFKHLLIIDPIKLTLFYKEAKICIWCWIDNKNQHWDSARDARTLKITQVVMESGDTAVINDSLYNLIHVSHTQTSIYL